MKTIKKLIGIGVHKTFFGNYRLTMLVKNPGIFASRTFYEKKYNCPEDLVKDLKLLRLNNKEVPRTNDDWKFLNKYNKE